MGSDAAYTVHGSAARQRVRIISSPFPKITDIADVIVVPGLRESIIQAEVHLFQNRQSRDNRGAVVSSDANMIDRTRATGKVVVVPSIGREAAYEVMQSWHCGDGSAKTGLAHVVARC